MTRILVHVEGLTEENFVNKILAGHLYQRGYSQVSARLMGDEPSRNRRGGIRGWPATKRNMVRRLREDRDRVNTTMVDYYGLPQSGANAWPGRAAAGRAPLAERAAAVEEAIQKDLRQELGDDFSPRRFFPYVMLHEFEAMLFSDCASFAQGIGRPDLKPKFQAIVDAAGAPEAIDDAPEGAPSKRIAKLVDNYEKPTQGIDVAREIGLEKIRSACPHFGAWLAQLEKASGTE